MDELLSLIFVSPGVRFVIIEYAFDNPDEIVAYQLKLHMIKRINRHFVRGEFNVNNLIVLLCKQGRLKTLAWLFGSCSGISYAQAACIEGFKEACVHNHLKLAKFVYSMRIRKNLTYHEQYDIFDKTYRSKSVRVLVWLMGIFEHLRYMNFENHAHGLDSVRMIKILIIKQRGSVNKISTDYIAKILDDASGSGAYRIIKWMFKTFGDKITQTQIINSFKVACAIQQFRVIKLLIDEKDALNLTLAGHQIKSA